MKLFFIYRSIAKCLLAPAVDRYHQQHTTPQAHIDTHQSALTLKRKLIFFSLFVELYTPSRRQKAKYMKSWSLLRVHVMSSDIFPLVLHFVKIKKRRNPFVYISSTSSMADPSGKTASRDAPKNVSLDRRESGKEKIIVYQQQRRKRNNHKKTSRYHQLRRRIYRAHRINTQSKSFSRSSNWQLYRVDTLVVSSSLHRCCHCQKKLKRARIRQRVRAGKINNSKFRE